MNVAKREEVFDVHEIKEPFEITFRGLGNLLVLLHFFFFSFSFFNKFSTFFFSG